MVNTKEYIWYYKCGTCGWTGSEKEVEIFATDEENIECCPVCWETNEHVQFVDPVSYDEILWDGTVIKHTFEGK